MPANGRDHQVLEEGKYFSSSKSQWPHPCNHHKPSLIELQSTTFSDYVRKVVLKEASGVVDPTVVPSEPCEDADSGGYHPPASRDIIDGPPLSLRNGMAKITLPEGFMENGGVEPTGRGPQWQEGTHLGDMMLPSPIKQVVRGIGGIYEYTFLDLEPMTVTDFRDRADEYLKSQVGKAEDMSIELLQRKFWKRLGPTMQPALYGADMEGTLFKKTDHCCGWNVSQLHSCLELLLIDQPDGHKGGIPGVTTPYLYFGMWASVFCAHTEDMNLLSINYLHAGAPKVWYAVAAGEDAQRLEQFCEGHYHQAKNGCPEYLRHKRALISPALLKKAGIPFTTTVQYPGDAMVTFPGSYHFGFNTGFNVAEATNFAVPEWVPYGRLANVCLCRPDSVRIDMGKFERLLLQYEKEVKQTKRIMWRDWAIKLRKKRDEDKDEAPQLATSSKPQDGARGQASRKPFWVEVMEPSGAKKTKRANPGSKKRRKEPEEIWHLAKPGGRKSLRPSARVLCIVPAVVDNRPREEGGSSSADEEDEECFRGVIVEVKDDHVRVRFDGLTKKDDTWISLNSPKLFLDGGRWGEDLKEDLPKLHYWKVEESKRRCV
mmetsp:Transcript_102270/g.295882  ORF Transcript_102270/g.295882 Transcript_102270/m.295882 type:complete len:599 (+) Transcript_102270:392-2188(+)